MSAIPSGKESVAVGIGTLVEDKVGEGVGTLTTGTGVKVAPWVGVGVRVGVTVKVGVEMVVGDTLASISGAATGITTLFNRLEITVISPTKARIEIVAPFQFERSQETSFAFQRSGFRRVISVSAFSSKRAASR
jgi:hypothetical protein